MLYLNAEDTVQGLFMYINSPGGSVTCGIGVYDAMNYVQADVTTICVGTAASMASFVLSGGTRGKRISLPNSRLMIHQPGGGSQGQTSLVLSEAEEMLRIRNDVITIYADRTGQSLARISQDMGRDQFMSAREAKQYGLVDQVASAII
jgi:ATP-dependent Clp protease, protease subunit